MGEREKGRKKKDGARDACAHVSSVSVDALRSGIVPNWKIRCARNGIKAGGILRASAFRALTCVFSLECVSCASLQRLVRLLNVPDRRVV